MARRWGYTGAGPGSKLVLGRKGQALELTFNHRQFDNG